MALPLKDNLPTRRVALVVLGLIALNFTIWLFWQPTLRDPYGVVKLGPSDNSITVPRLEAFLFENASISCELTTGRPLTVGEARVLIDEGVDDACGRSPRRAREGDSLPLIPGKNVYFAGFVSMFLHGSFIHFFGNMFFLLVLGNNVEDRFGHLRFLAFYLLCGISSDLLHTAMTAKSAIPTLGASGAVAGVMAGFLVLFPWARVFTLLSIPLPLTAYLPAWIPLGIWFAIQFTPLVGSNVAVWGHIGGFIAGVILTPLVVVSIRPPRLAPEPAGPVFINPL